MELPKEYKTPHPMNSLPISGTIADLHVQMHRAPASNPALTGKWGCADNDQKLAAYGAPDGDDTDVHYHSRGSTHVEMLNKLDQEHNLPITGKRNSTWCAPIAVSSSRSATPLPHEDCWGG